MATVRKILIKAGTVLSLDPTVGTVSRADILVDGAKIAAVGPDLKVGDCERIDASNCIVSPGFVDTHRHVWQANMRGICADWSLIEYLRGIRLHLATFYRPEDVYSGIMLGAVEALRAGVTTLYDFCHIINSPEHADAALAALRDAKSRAIFAYGFNDVPLQAPAFKDHISRLQDATRVRRELCPSNDALVRMGVSLSEPDFAPFAQVKAELDTARDLGIPVTMHLGFDRQMRGRGALESLNAAALLGPDIVYVHCNWLSDRELQIIKDTGGAVSVTPETEMQMGMGFPATNQALKNGLKPSLGIDIVTEMSGDMFAQMRLALQTARALENEQMLVQTETMPTRITLTCRDALGFATTNGAVAMGLDRKIGSISPGKEADLVLTRTDTLNMTPVTDPVAALVLQAHPGNVDCVFVAGRPVVRGGKFVDIDVDTVRRNALQSWEYLSDRAGTLLPTTGHDWQAVYTSNR